MTDRDRNRDHNRTWTRLWSCLSQPFRKRRRALPDEDRRHSDACGSRREREAQWRDLPRWEAARRELPREPRRDMRRPTVEARNEVRKRYRAPSPETFDKLRQAIIQVEEASNVNKSKSKLGILEEDEFQDIQEIPQEVVDIVAQEDS